MKKTTKAPKLVTLLFTQEEFKITKFVKGYPVNEVEYEKDGIKVDASKVPHICYNTQSERKAALAACFQELYKDWVDYRKDNENLRAELELLNHPNTQND